TWIMRDPQTIPWPTRRGGRQEYRCRRMRSTFHPPSKWATVPSKSSPKGTGNYSPLGGHRRRNSPRIPDDLPEVAVGVTEVPGIDSPGTVMRCCDRRACSLGLAQQLVDLLSGSDELAKTELGALRRSGIELSV